MEKSKVFSKSTMQAAIPVLLIVFTGLEIFLDSVNQPIGVYLTKPLLMPLLIVFILMQVAQLDRLTKFVLTGLVLSTFGDVFLMLRSADFFVPGLASFLLAHVCYIMGFKSILKSNGGQPKSYVLAVFGGLSLFLTGFLWVLLSAMLESEEKKPFIFPVIVYAVVITSMGLVMAMRRGLVSNPSFRYGIIGAISFIVSDSILATNLFVRELPLASLWVMSTYVFAQYCLVKAAIESK